MKTRKRKIRASKVTAVRAADDCLDITCRAFSGFRGQTLNKETRTIDAVMATQEPVMVFDYYRMQPIREVLRMDGCNYPQQVPLLDSHNRDTIGRMAGSTRSMRVEGDKLIGTRHFSTNDLGSNAFGLASDGHLTDGSIGYRVDEFEMIEAGTSKTIKGKRYTAPQDMALRIATKWTVREDSLTAIGADEQAKFRAATDSGSGRNKPHKGDYDMLNKAQRAHIAAKGYSDEQIDGLSVREINDLLADFSTRSDSGTPPPPAGNAAVEAARAADQLRTEGMKAEQARQTLIRELAGEAIPETLVNQAISEGWDQARATTEFYAHTISEQTRQSFPGAPAAHIKRGESQRESLEAGMLMRCGTSGDALIESYGYSDKQVTGGERFAEATLLDICRAALQLEGKHVPHGRDELVERALTTISLPVALGNVAHKSALQGYQEVDDTWSQWCSEGSVTDFKEHTRVRMTDIGDLEDLLPNGEFASGSLAEEYEKQKIGTKGKKITIGREMFYNDDMNVLSKIPQALGRKAKSKIGDMVYACLMANGNMTDGAAVFSAGAGNLLTSNPLAPAGLEASEQAFYKIVDKDGKPIDVSGKYLIAPPKLKNTARALLEGDTLIAIGAGATAATTSNKNLNKGCLVPVIERRLQNATYTNNSLTTWYVIADKSQAESIEVAYLLGRKSPSIRKFTNIPGFLGMILEIYIDAGVKVIDRRAMQKCTA